MRTVIVLTRERRADAALAAVLTARGLDVVHAPCIEIAPGDHQALREALGSLTSSDALVVTSPRGARSIAAAWAAPRADAAVASLGQATAAALREAGIEPDHVASDPSGASLARELPLPSGTVLLARSDRALRDLPRILAERGARVREVVAYRARPVVPTLDGDSRARLDAADRVVAVLRSPTAVAGFTASGLAALARLEVVASGAVTAAAARERLAAAVRVAGAPDDEGIARAVTGIGALA